MLKTCSKTEIPPKPSKKEVMIILIESFLQAILDILLIPLVISKNPVTRGEMKLESMFNALKMGEILNVIRFNSPHVFNIEIILEKIATKPPISNIVDILLVILSARTSPRLEKVTKVFLFVYMPEFVSV